MKVAFYKYQGTGNDFIIIDNRQEIFHKNNTKLIAQLCDRRFGIGADGLILLEQSTNYDFKMVYFNADGNESTMCGNGGRCIVAFANKLGIIDQKTTFEAIDGKHFATIENDVVSLEMIDVNSIETTKDYSFLDTGSPHHVQLVENLNDFDVFNKGRAIRNNIYGTEGSNVNFVSQINDDTFRVRTYERGVEDETLACGTGVTAVAIAMHSNKQTRSNKVNLEVEGGILTVSFTSEGSTYTNVFLTGKATFVFTGEIECN